MHELAVCQSLIGQVERVARDHGAHRVSSVTVRVGPLSGVVCDLLQQAWPLGSAGTVADGAALVLEASGIRVRCTRCGGETEARSNRLVCGDCGDWRTELISGDELILASLELETPQRALPA